MTCFMEALIKFTNVKPDSPEGVILFNSYFISQPAPDIQTKLKKSNVGPQFSWGGGGAS